MIQQAGSSAVQVVNALAAKLAIPAAQLWAVLIRQVPIEVGKDVAVLLFCALASYGLVRGWRAVLETDSDVGEFIGIPLLLAAIAVGILSIVASVALVNDVGYLFNPQFFALHQILDALRGGTR